MTRDMSSFGEKLRVLRESREITLDEIAESTKISKRYLQALERNEFEELPGGVFAKGYIRTYAEYLGVNPEPLLEAYVSELQSRGEGDPAEDEKAARQAAQAALSKLAGTSPDEARSGFGPGAKYALLGVIGVGLVAVLVWVLLGVLGSEPDESAVAEVAPATEARSQPRAEVPVRPEAPPSRSGNVAAQSQAQPALEEPKTQPASGERPTASGRIFDEPEPAAPSRREPQPVTERVLEPHAEPGPITDRPVESRPPRQEPGPVTQPVNERPEVASPPATPTREEPADEGSTASRLEVSEFGVGTDVVNRQLVGQSNRFAVGTRVVFWTRVIGGQRGDTIRHVWIREGSPVGTIELNIGAAHWRTQSRWTLRQGAGQWAVEARDARDQVLARAEFDCVAAD
jgi:cytoskeletal protein RodZ